MADCSIIYDLANQGYDEWWFPATGLLAAGFAGTIYGLFRSLFKNIVPTAAKKSARRAIFFSLILALLAFIWTYSEYSNLRKAYEGGAYQQVSGEIEHFADTGPGLQPGTVRFSVGKITFSYSRYAVSPGFRKTRDLGSPLHEGLMVRIRYIGTAIVRLEVCGS
ncbi:MAG TPA: hypothetical protein VN980_19185 [Alphaproteobacteria bacterium]|nr:hypothetical protein [Alphaproteobacteria bacterium]